MKQLLQFLIGIALCGLGIFLLLSNINVSSLTFYRIGEISTAPILIILLIIFVIIAVVVSKWWSYLLVFIDIVGMIISVIIGTHFTFRSMSALTLVIMVAVFAIGVGLIIKSLFNISKDENKDK